MPARVDGSDAECAFAVVRRGLEAEGGPNEEPLPTFVSRRFVDASDGEQGLALLHDGLLEYEVVDGPSGYQELALTLLWVIGITNAFNLAHAGVYKDLQTIPAGPGLSAIASDAPSCSECGGIMTRNGSCYKCENCGGTSGCS